MGKYPAGEATKLILGLLAAPAIVYGLNSFGRVRNGLYDKLKGALEGTETKDVSEPQKTEASPNIAAGSAPAVMEE